MDAEDQLLLPEGLCRQLGIVTYHGDVEARPSQLKQKENVTVPVVRVKLLESLQLLPQQSAT